MINLRVDMAAFKRDLDRIAHKQVPFATALALNDVAQDIDADWKNDLATDLDNPTPFTMRGVYRRRASKRNLVARVGMKDIQAGYLALQVTGGVRRPKKRALVIPAGIRLNKYGNMARGALSKLGPKPSTFVVSKGSRRARHLTPGIYERPKARRGRSGGSSRRNSAAAKGPKLLVSFKGKASYRRRLNLYDTAQRAVDREFVSHFARRFREAMATAR